jgi:hypothetical protein
MRDARAPSKLRTGVPLKGGRTWWAHFEFTRVNTTPCTRSPHCRPSTPCGRVTQRRPCCRSCVSWGSDSFLTRRSATASSAAKSACPSSSRTMTDARPTRALLKRTSSAIFGKAFPKVFSRFVATKLRVINHLKTFQQRHRGGKAVPLLFSSDLANITSQEFSISQTKNCGCVGSSPVVPCL